jgi:uncharacterized protein (DUF849 family)
MTKLNVTFRNLANELKNLSSTMTASDVKAEVEAFLRNAVPVTVQLTECTMYNVIAV